MDRGTIKKGTYKMLSDTIHNEIWRDIKDYEGLYQVSNYGRVKSITFRNGTTKSKRDKLLKFQIRNNYYIVNLSKGGKRKQWSVHRLVAQEFLERPNGCNIVNHLDYNTFNNVVSNLSWCTQKENVNYSKVNMLGKNHIQRDKTYCICYREKLKVYELTIKKKYYGYYKTLEEAILKRKEVFDEIGVSI